MTDNFETSAGSALIAADAFTQVAILRALGEVKPPWSPQLEIRSDSCAEKRLAELLEAGLSDPTPAVLNPEDSNLLVALLTPLIAHDAVLAPALADAVVKQAQDESMNAIEILASGIAISLVLITATTEVDYRAGEPIRIVKRALDDTTILKIVELLSKLVKLPRGDHDAPKQISVHDKDDDGMLT